MFRDSMSETITSVFSAVQGRLTSRSVTGGSTLRSGSSSSSSSSADCRVLGFHSAGIGRHPRVLFLAGFLSHSSMRSLVALSPSKTATCIRADVASQRLALAGGIDVDKKDPSPLDLEARRQAFACSLVNSGHGDREPLRRRLFEELTQILRSKDTGLCVVFVPTVKEVEELFELWKSTIAGIHLPAHRRAECVHAAVFHGQLRGDKQMIFNNLVHLGPGQLCFVFATEAFGLGVNVLHIFSVIIYGMYGGGSILYKILYIVSI